MADDHEEPLQPVVSKADALAMIEQAEAEAAEAEAMAAAARARARAARLRREALTLAEAAEDYGDAAAAAADVEPTDYYSEGYGAEHDEPAAEEYDEYYGEGSADEYDEAEEPEYELEPDGSRSRLPSISLMSKVGALVLICVLAGLSAYMVLEHRDSTRQHRREAAFAAGAKQGVTYMISLDFTKAKEDFQRVVDSATGRFKEDFEQKANDFITVVEQSKAITEGTVNAAAVETMNDDSAVVLVSATSHVTNSPPGKDEPPKSWRLRVTVTDVDGQYKMSKVEYVA
ncbi:hypothetical protein [Mycobacterium parmense]|nr:hypothetical protein [Mycobacterium parmense]MCV7349040.1 hypothetical protein [Mycobacterium parmense]ORW58505.1 hypothetical protein AWC20_11730 [Mycobacterium parmense]